MSFWTSLTQNKPKFEFSASLPVPSICLCSVVCGLFVLPVCVLCPAPNKGFFSVFIEHHRNCGVGQGQELPYRLQSSLQGQKLLY